MDRDAIAIEMLKAILAGRSYVMPLKIEYVKEYLEEWIKMAYLISDKCLEIRSKEGA